MYSNNAQIKIKDGIPWQKDGDKALILDADESFAHELNGSALFIWSKISTGTSFQELKESYLCEFDAPTEVLSQDLIKTVELLNSLKLINIKEHL